MAEPHILIVDDEPAMRLALGEVLRRQWKVSDASDGKEAVGLLEREAFDLIITDVRMPEMTGIELLEVVKRCPDAPPVIVMTAFGTVEDAVTAMRSGAVDYMMKPFSAEVAIEAAKSALAKRAAATQAKASGRVAPPAPKTQVTSTHPLIASDSKSRALIEFVETIADSEATVMITGESGVGKEVVARHIHRKSRRANGPFIAVNCAALPDTLLESELFGFEKGAFTGAVQARPGKFELAAGGTILLDEVSEMPLSLQAKLLRVLQERTVDPIGARTPMAVDIRVIATSNRDLAQTVMDGEFRQDLYYRLNVISVEVPTLRDRAGDIEPLALFFVNKHAMRNGRRVPKVTEQVLRYLRDQRWLGNVRELENFMERAVLLTRGEEMQLSDLHLSTATMSVAPTRVIDDERPTTLADMERQMIVTTLNETGGNRTRAAEILGVSVRTIRNKINEYGLRAAV